MILNESVGCWMLDGRCGGLDAVGWIWMSGRIRVDVASRHFAYWRQLVQLGKFVP